MVHVLLKPDERVTGRKAQGLQMEEIACKCQTFLSWKQVFGVVNKAEIDVFLELSCFFYDSTDAGNLVSGSSAISKSSLYIWKFLVHVLLKPNLKDFGHNLASM